MRNYEGTCKGICSYNLIYNFLIQFLQLQSPVFVVHFSNAFWYRNEAFPKVVLLSQEYENIFSLVQLSKSKFFHSCRTGVVRVALVSHLCRIRVTRIWRSCCKLKQIHTFNLLKKILTKYNQLFTEKSKSIEKSFQKLLYSSNNAIYRDS